MFVHRQQGTVCCQAQSPTVVCRRKTYFPDFSFDFINVFIFHIIFEIIFFLWREERVYRNHNVVFFCCSIAMHIELMRIASYLHTLIERYFRSGDKQAQRWFCDKNVFTLESGQNTKQLHSVQCARHGTYKHST